MTQRREAQPGQGRGKGAVSPARRGSAVENRWPRGARELVEVGYETGQIAGSRPDRWLVGAHWGSRLGAACWGRHRQPRIRWPLPLDGTEQERGEKREGEREGSGFKLNFLKIPSRNLKNFEHKSCRKFENVQLLF
jgi:hypothetical protein